MKVLGMLLAALLVLFCTIGLFLPQEYRVEETVIINAAPAEIHQYIHDLERWAEWGPWEQEDPSLVVTAGNPSAGVGATQSWTGDSGSGRLLLTSSDPNMGVTYDIWFDDDAWYCKAGIRYQVSAAGTQVMWWMDGETDVPIIGGWFSLLIDSMTSGMFSAGMNNLKLVVESAPDRP